MSQPVRSALVAVFVFFCVFSGLAITSAADELQPLERRAEQKQRFNRKLFFTQTAVLASSAAFDWTTTSNCQQRGCQESESRWAIGAFPSNSQIARYGATWFAGDVTLLYFTERSRHRWLRWAGRAFISYETQNHFMLGFHNRGLCHPTNRCGGKL